MVPEGWDEKPLNALVSGNQLGTIERGETSRRTIPLIKMGNLTWGGLALGNVERLDEDKCSTNLLLEPGDLLFNTRNTPELVGKTALWQGELPQATFDNNINRIRLKRSCDPKFIAAFMSHGLGKRRIRSLAAGSTSVAAIYWKDLSHLRLLVPPLAEQKKIAEILSIWDEAIETTANLLANADAQKLALMQKLLTGKRRLKGFEGTWHTTTLGELGETYGGLTGKSKDDFGSGAPYITYMMVFGNSAIDMSKVDFVTVGPKEAQHRVKIGDIFFTTSSETPDEVGMSSVLLDDPGECYLNSFCFGYRLLKTAALIPEFARYLLRGQTFRRDIRKLAQGATRYNLSKRELMKLQIKVPVAEEQREIVKVLDTANDAVESLKQQLARLETEKRGLMQQLLTGKRRVTV